MTVTCVNDAPVADNETFNGNESAHGNTTLQVDDPSDDKPAPANPHTEITGDILAGDTDVEPDPLSVTPARSRRRSHQQPNDGGSVTSRPTATSSSSRAGLRLPVVVLRLHVSRTTARRSRPAPGRVTITIAGCVWYVQNTRRRRRRHLQRAVRHAPAGRDRVGHRPHGLRLRRRQHADRLRRRATR